MIYEDQIRRYGGAYGVRDMNLLQSAVDLNGFEFDSSEEEIYEVMMAVASGTMDKPALTAVFERCAKETS